MEKEVWKHIPGAFAYEVSSLGNVRNSNTGWIKKPSKRKDGSSIVNIVKDNGFETTFTVPSLMLRTFAPHLYKSGISPIHMDGNADNNELPNLCISQKGVLIPLVPVVEGTQPIKQVQPQKPTPCPVLHRYELICRDRLQMAGMMVQRYEDGNLVGYKAPDGSIYALTVSGYSEKLENAIALLHNEAIQHTVKWLDEVVKEEE